MSDHEFAVNHPLRRRLPGPDEWSSALDQSIADAEKRGDFDNLPGHGKPIQFNANPLTGEVDVGMGLLKGAGFAPGWIELDKEIRAKLNDLETARTSAAMSLARLSISTQTGPPPRPRRQSWWQTFLHGSRAHRAEPTRSTPDHATTYERALSRYLEQAGEIDTLIASFNSSIPRELWQLERQRLSQDTARREFDEAVQSKRTPDS